MARITMLTPDQLDAELRRRSRADDRTPLERPMDAEDLTPAERIAIRYGELMATDHLAVDDDFYDRLRQHFSEAEIVELGLNVAMFVGVGRLSATWDMVDELPERFQQPGEVVPCGADDALVLR